MRTAVATLNWADSGAESTADKRGCDDDAMAAVALQCKMGRKCGEAAVGGRDDEVTAPVVASSWRGGRQQLCATGPAAAEP